jgi:hypothetical protein
MRNRHPLLIRLMTSTTLSSIFVGCSPWPGEHLDIAPVPAEARSLDGRGNNLLHDTWGVVGSPYRRVAPAQYADGVSAMVHGTSPRWLSNRVFNDLGQNLFSEHAVSQWGWVWAQFLDHDVGLRDERLAEHVPMPFDARDRLERFANTSGGLEFFRTPAAPGTGVGAVGREQLNTLSSFIDGSAVYGTTLGRSSWLRDGAHLLLPGGFLPAAGVRGDVARAPVMDLFGPQTGHPARAVVAGDVRANENIALTAVQTLFAREHNRIVDALPADLDDEHRFQIARRVVGAEIQRITYREFLPAMGVRLPRYRGYDPQVDPSLTNEFATVGFRGHSMVHGEFETEVPEGTYPAAQLAAFARQGITVTRVPAGVALTIPLSVAFGNPALVRTVGLGTLLGSFGERQYKNDEQIDDTLRSVLFQSPTSSGDTTCTGPVLNRDCFSLVSDLGAVDVLRQRDHGIPGYNTLRRAYGLPAVGTFRQITGESTETMPAHGTKDDPAIMRFTALRDVQGRPVALGTPNARTDAVVGVRTSTTAARLKMAYGTVAAVDAFTGMAADKHLPGSELGPLQHAMWTDQFTALRDGDRFFFRGDPVLRAIRHRYGLSSGHTLSEIIALNTGKEVPADVFHGVIG